MGSDGLEWLGMGGDTEEQRGIGAPTIEAEYADSMSSERAPMYYWLFCQPLLDIRDYYGEEIALYFAWVGYLALLLVFPAIVGVGNQVYYIIVGYTWCDATIGYVQVATAVITVLWGVFFKESWLGQQRLFAVRCGTQGVEEEEMDRPQFRGTDYRRDPVSLRRVLYFPEDVRSGVQLRSSLIMLLCCALVSGDIYGLFYVESFLRDMGYTWANYAVYGAIAIQIPIFHDIFTKIARDLTEGENYQTETVFIDAMIMKTFTFTFFNL